MAAHAKATWVSNALEDEDADPEAVKLAFSKRFGEKAVIHDPNDLEANKIAVAAGYTVVPGGALPKAAWKNVKGAGAVLPAGQVTPSPNPSAGDEQLKIMDPDHYTQPIENVVAFAREFGEALLERPVQVRVATDVKWPFNAAYAHTYSLDSFVTRLRSLAEVERFVDAGIPVVVSLSWKLKDMPEATYETNGHLLVIVGFTDDGDPVLNDPASNSNDNVRSIYTREQVFGDAPAAHGAGRAAWQARGRPGIDTGS